MQINPYLSFKGDCEAAFKCYERCLGGQLWSDLPLRWHAHGGSSPGRLAGQGDARQSDGRRSGLDGWRRGAGELSAAKRLHAVDPDQEHGRRRAYVTSWRKTGRSCCRWRKRSWGPRVLACSSIASAYPGGSTDEEEGESQKSQKSQRVRKSETSKVEKWSTRSTVARGCIVASAHPACHERSDNPGLPSVLDAASVEGMRQFPDTIGGAQVASTGGLLVQPAGRVHHHRSARHSMSRRLMPRA